MHNVCLKGLVKALLNKENTTDIENFFIALQNNLNYPQLL